MQDSQSASPNRQTVMDRRRFLLATGSAVGVVGLSACTGATETGPALRSGGVFFDTRGMTAVDIISDIMIPETDTPGARAVDAAAFTDGMMEGWALPDSQRDVAALLDWISNAANTRHRKDFLALAPPQQEALVETIDAATFDDEPGPLPDNVGAGYRTLKHCIYRGYYLSETGATVELRYEPVPGDFRGCVPFAEIGRTWAL